MWYKTFILVLYGTTTINAFGPYGSHEGIFGNSGTQRQIVATQRNGYKKLTPVYEAKNIEFGFPSEAERLRVLANGDYQPDTPIPIDVDVYYASPKDAPSIFMTIPRFDRGVPYSLAYLTTVQRPNGSQLQPYPSYEWHTDPGVNCNRIQSAYRTQIDACGQMWVIDSGEIGLVHMCPPKLLVFNLRTAKLVDSYVLPATMYKQNISRFVSLVVDIVGDTRRCDRAFVYMADPTGNGIVVYDKQANNSWRIENKYTYPDPAFGTHTIADQSFELLDGAFGLSVTPAELKQERLLYFHSLSSDLQMAIRLADVNNATKWTQGISSSLDKFIELGRRGVQCAAPTMSTSGYLLCGYLQPIAIFAWSISTPYTHANRLLIVENPETLQFVSGLKVIRNSWGKEEVWMSSNRLQKAFTRTTNFSEINYRIQKCGLNELLNRLPCSR